MQSATTQTPLQPYGIANVDKQPHDRQMPCKGHNLPTTPAQISCPWYPQGPEGSIMLLEIAKPLFLLPHNILNRRDLELLWKICFKSFLFVVTAQQKRWGSEPSGEGCYGGQYPTRREVSCRDIDMDWPSLGQYYIWNGSLRQVLPESRDGMTASRAWQNGLPKGRHGSPRREPYCGRIHIWDHPKGIKPYGHLAQYRGWPETLTLILGLTAPPSLTAGGAGGSPPGFAVRGTSRRRKKALASPGEGEWHSKHERGRACWEPWAHIQAGISGQRESRPARTQGTLRLPKMLGGQRPSWWKWARSGALS